ncbi:hypothetical protein [Adhaeribacter terreus]|uniref:DUF1735 domain-containing protein n=1 Tax=Adhaeribacter terreus TaxID=529703 RepID=A0ABW0EDH4_9BACT
MKKSYYLLLLLVVAVFSGCKKEEEDPVDKLFSFDIKNEKGFVATKDEINAAYAASANGFNFPLPVSGVAGDTEASFQKNNTSTSLVTEVKVREVYLTMPDNATEDFSFLEKVDIYIATDVNDPNPLLMAYNRAIPTNVGKKLVFTPTDASVAKYVKAGTYALILKDYKMARQVTSDLSITARITYTVTANPLK